MMVAPVDAQKYKTKYVAQEHGNQGQERGGAGDMRHSEFKHHDGDAHHR